ncbi:MAG TPA: hypothetical protein VKA54_23650 [Gemmatimonadaceae bacterium]|nr:hypothetical protein [Gemmatimonadaceae bacterium]
MRVSFLLLAAPVVITLVPPAPAAAQDGARVGGLAVAPAPRLAVGSGAGTYTITMAPIVAPARAQGSASKPGAAGRVFRAAVGIGVGAAVGGWLGYFGAQVANSDWKSISASEKTELRQGYTMAGLGIGAIAGYFLRPKGRTVSQLPQPFSVPPRSGRLLLASGELRRSVATNVLEAVEMDRPEWMKQQRADEAKRGGDAPSSQPVETISLVVYVGDERVGAVETLRDIAIPEVAELRFYDARDARRRWGVEHKYGAIEVVPATAAAESAATVPTAGK